MNHENDNIGLNALVNGFKVVDTISSSLPSSNGVLKKRGRPPKVKLNTSADSLPLKQSKMTDTMKKARRTVNRFNGVTKEELMQKQLPDRIKHGLDILIIGINPGLFAAYKGHHYAGPGNHFWDCITMSGLIKKPASSENDVELLDQGIGFSTIVQRTTASSKELSSQEIRDGGKNLIEKIRTFYPKIAVFNGKGIYEIFSKEVFGQKKKEIVFGKQPNLIPGTNTLIFVMPSSSARCSQFPRAQDKVHFYIELKRLRDEVNGFKSDPDLQETSYSFDRQKATEALKLEKYDPSYNGQQLELTTPSSSSHPPTTSQPFNLFVPIHKNSTDNRKVRSPLNKKVAKKSSNATSHPNLVKILNEAEKPAGTPSTLPRSSLRHLKEVVSDEMRNERVGRWVRTQMDQNYENELPMGYEERLRAGEISGDQAESDQGSQQSMLSLGVSGSTSTGSTSGYGSVDSHPHRALQDRVEMWVREQQYVRQQVEPRRPLQPDSDYPTHQQADRWPQRQQVLYGAPIDEALLPPVPLYSSWGGGDVSMISRNPSEGNSAACDLGHLQGTSLLP